jgi:hypothetical protein
MAASARAGCGSPTAVIALADRLHAGSWRALARTRIGAHLAEDRGTRVALLAVVHIAGAFILTLISPLWLMLLAPLLLGVPHVASDIRHLILKPPTPVRRSLVGVLLLPFGAMTLMRAVAIAGGPLWISAELVLGAVAVLVAASWGTRPLWNRVVATVAVLSLLSVALARPKLAALIIGHLHNFVAVGIWFWFMGRSVGKAKWLIAVLIPAAVLVLGFSGIEESLGLATAAPAAGLSLSSMVNALAPGIPQPYGVRLVLIFAMMQAVHYSMWLWCIPQSPAAVQWQPPQPPSKRWSRWSSDLGRLGVGAVIIGAIALPSAGVVAPVDARAGYLSLVLFHGWLELALIAHFVTQRG